MRNLLQTYKDIVVWTIAILWLCSNVITYMVCGAEALCYSNAAFILLMCILIIVMRLATRFSQLLNRELWKK